jgi:hypothetical protein
MEIDKEFVIQHLREAGKEQHLQKALAELPDKIDHEQHAQQLQKLGIDPGELVLKAERSLL